MGVVLAFFALIAVAVSVEIVADSSLAQRPPVYANVVLWSEGGMWYKTVVTIRCEQKYDW